MLSRVDLLEHLPWAWIFREDHLVGVLHIIIGLWGVGDITKSMFHFSVSAYSLWVFQASCL